MNVRYFFIAGAITSSLSFAIKESDRIVNKEISHIADTYTIEENDLQLLDPTNITLDAVNILETQRSSGE